MHAFCEVFMILSAVTFRGTFFSSLPFCAQHIFFNFLLFIFRFFKLH